MSFFNEHILKGYAFHFFFGGKRRIYIARCPDPLMAYLCAKTMSKIKGHYKTEKITRFTWLKVKLMIRLNIAKLNN